MFVDGIASGLNMDDAQTVQLRAQDGFQEVAEMVNSGKVRVQGFQVIVLLCGRADLWQADKSFKIGVGMCLSALQVANNKAMIVLTGTLPSPGDERRVVRTAIYRNSYLSQLSNEGPRVEFSKPGRMLLQTGGPIAGLF